jgi:hypothetical protein
MDWLIDWLFIVLRPTQEYFTSALYGDVTVTGEGLQTLGPCSALKVFEQGEIFIVPHLLWYGASVFQVSSEGPPHSVPSYDTQWGVEVPDPHRSVINGTADDICTCYETWTDKKTDMVPVYTYDTGRCAISSLQRTLSPQMFTIGIYFFQLNVEYNYKIYKTFLLFFFTIFTSLWIHCLWFEKKTNFDELFVLFFTHFTTTNVNWTAGAKGWYLTWPWSPLRI